MKFKDLKFGDYFAYRQSVDDCCKDDSISAFRKIMYSEDNSAKVLAGDSISDPLDENTEVIKICIGKMN